MWDVSPPIKNNIFVQLCFYVIFNKNKEDIPIVVFASDILFKREACFNIIRSFEIFENFRAMMLKKHCNAASFMHKDFYKIIKNQYDEFLISKLKKILKIKFDNKIILIPIDFLQYISFNKERFEKTIKKNVELSEFLYEYCEIYMKNFITALKFEYIYIIILSIACFTDEIRPKYLIIISENIIKLVQLSISEMIV